MPCMKERTYPRAALQPEGAFVVQLHSDAEIELERISGRIEHLKSGDSAPFASLEAMLAFMAKHTGGDDQGR